MMWTHYCIVDRAWISVGKNEPCNWCAECERKPEVRHSEKVALVDVVR